MMNTPKKTYKTLIDAKKILFVVGISFMILVPYAFSLRDAGLYVDKLVLFFVVSLSSVYVLSRFLYVVIAVFVLVNNVIYLHIKYRWGLDWLEARVETALESPFFEIVGYVKSYFGWLEFWVFVYFVFSFYLVLRLLMFGKIRHGKYVYLAISVMFLTCFSVYIRYEKVVSLPFLKFSSSIVQANDRIEKIDERNSFILKENFEKKVCNERYEKIIIVIGESATKSRMSLYGYQVKTTPFLDSLSPKFLNAISPANLTRFSVPMMLTSATADNFSKFFSSRSLVSELKDCGYQTFWISNQGERGANETFISSIAKEADHRYYLNEKFYEKVKYDGSFIESLDVVGFSKLKLQAVFLHLAGSHFDYRDRFPVETKLVMGDSVENSYDNSIFYTDYVLSELFEKINTDNFIFIYVSDHGEVVDDLKHGHGFSPSYKEEYEIPLVVYATNKSRIDLVEKISYGKTINAESFNLLVEYLVGITDAQNISYSDKVLSVKDDQVVEFSELRKYH